MKRVREVGCISDHKRKAAERLEALIKVALRDEAMSIVKDA
jgi:hypothetical protein